MVSNELLCKDQDNKRVDCGTIESLRSKYESGTVNMWTEWIDGQGIQKHMTHLIRE